MSNELTNTFKMIDDISAIAKMVSEYGIYCRFNCKDDDFEDKRFSMYDNIVKEMYKLV